jgi:Ca2+-binding RTX toxin-like protein
LLPTIAEVAADSGLTAREVLTAYTEPGFAGLPDPITAPDGSFEGIYYTGDNRATQQAPLVTLQTTLAREHNYQVDQLTPYATAHNWTDDQLFNAAREITTAEWQHVVFEEYAPTLIGSQADDLLEAYKNFVGLDAYNAIGPGIINEWTTVGFRFGHDQSSNDYAVDGGVISLAQAFSALGVFADDSLATTREGIDAWIQGLAAQSAQEIDGKVADGNREFLFNGAGGTSQVDLEAFDIQRGRDHGVWNYNELRAGLGLSTYATFDAFASANGYAHDDPSIAGDSPIIEALKDVYGDDISNADSIVMGLLEHHYADSQLGETFTLLSAIQFDLLKQDPNYYEDRLADNPELLADIKGTTFAEILERNSGTLDNPGTVSHLHLDSVQVANVMEGTNKGDVMHGADIMYDADSNAYLQADNMIGGDGNDKLYGGYGNDTLYGDNGNDWLYGEDGDDFLRGGAGNDLAYGGLGNDNVKGEDGNDTIDLGFGDDWADGGKGNDNIVCGAGDDIALGKEGNDSISGGIGKDEVFGGDGRDTVKGDAGDDKCYGGAGDDLVSGGAGNDLINGEAGNDKLYGDLGSDTFAFDAGSGKDTIYDFNVKQDYIDLSDLEQFDSFADIQGAMTTNRGVTIIDLGDTDLDGHNDVIELVGVSQKVLKEANFVIYHDDAAVA